MPITAAQLLYANVEKDRSPHQRSGFQTLFYSQSRLSEAEVDAIEGYPLKPGHLDSKRKVRPTHQRHGSTKVRRTHPTDCPALSW